MVNVPRIHCHSAFKHYQMFHCNRESSYGNSIFNTTYNFNGGGFGGGFMGGLWGGLGMGLGAGLMNMFGGLFGGGMFGGMGMYGMGGFPFGGYWGGFGGSRQTDGAGGKDKIIEKEVNDRDISVLRDLEKEIQSVEKKAKDGTLTESELKAAKDKVTEESGKSDKYNKKEHDEHYQLLLKRLNNIQIKPNDDKDDEEVLPPEEPGNTGTEETNKVSLAFGKRIGGNYIDDKIEGVIKQVKLDKGQAIQYVIDSNIDGQEFKLRYLITKESDTEYRVKCISTKHSVKDSKGKPIKLYKHPDGVVYTKGEDGKLYNNNGAFVVSTRQGNGYLPLDYKENITEDDYDYSDTEGLEDADKYTPEVSANGVDITVKVKKDDKEE